MIAVRVSRTGSGYYVFLIVNLFLAGVPVFLSTALRVADYWECHRIVRLVHFLSVVIVSAKCTLHSHRHTALNSRVSRSRLVRPRVVALVFRDGTGVGIPVTRRRASDSGPQLWSCLWLDPGDGVADVKWICSLSRQVPALEQLGRFDRTVPTIRDNGRRSTPVGPHKSSVSDVNLRRYSHTRIHHAESLTGPSRAFLKIGTICVHPRLTSVRCFAVKGERMFPLRRLISSVLMFSLLASLLHGPLRVVGRADVRSLGMRRDERRNWFAVSAESWRKAAGDEVSDKAGNCKRIVAERD